MKTQRNSSNLDAFVVYCKDRNTETPFAVVSNNFECKALSNYIPKRLKDLIIPIEDKRFFEHGAIDLKSIARASYANLMAGRIVQGGSTITQQLARNLLNDNSKTFSRKIREGIKAISLENRFSKDEILNLYFNNVYFGKNIRGIRAAGLVYFGKEIGKLTQSECLYLITLLRGPNYYLKHPLFAENRFKMLNKILLNENIISPSRYKKNQLSKCTLKANQLRCINSVALPFITEKVINKELKIYATVNLKLQVFVDKFISNSKYPLSIVAVSKNKVLAFGSSYGSDYPFVARSNVGSTLKPFLYCYLRENGILPFEHFDSIKNELTWQVREAKKTAELLTINEALYHSNNNAFINATHCVGLQGAMEFLASVLKRPVDEFFPSSILGATKKGITLYELACAYSNFFTSKQKTEIHDDCLSILNRIFTEKLGFQIDGAFLKTGTTNNNKERFAMLGNADLTFALLRNEYYEDDGTKEGNFFYEISREYRNFFTTDYKWT